MATATLNMLAAVDAAIDKARETHPEIPEVTVVLGASGVMRKGQKHGHYAPQSWTERKEDEEAQHYGELLLSGESLKRGGRETLGTILHELAHAYAHANDIQDTSNGNRYHNKRFKEIAEDFGLVIDRADVIGWSVTTVPDDTAEFYADEIEALDAAITQYRVPRIQAAQTQKQRKYLMQCPECKDPLQTTKKWFENNEFRLFCSEHGTPFEMYVEEPA